RVQNDLIKIWITKKRVQNDLIKIWINQEKGSERFDQDMDQIVLTPFGLSMSPFTIPRWATTPASTAPPCSPANASKAVPIPEPDQDPSRRTAGRIRVVGGHLRPPTTPTATPGGNGPVRESA